MKINHTKKNSKSSKKILILLHLLPFSGKFRLFVGYILIVTSSIIESVNSTSNEYFLLCLTQLIFQQANIGIHYSFLWFFQWFLRFGVYFIIFIIKSNIHMHGIRWIHIRNARKSVHKRISEKKKMRKIAKNTTFKSGSIYQRGNERRKDKG